MLGKVVVTGAISAALVMGVTSSASAEVVYKKPQRSVCQGAKVKFGIGHKPGTGGPRKVRAVLRNPRGRVVGRLNVRAKNHWSIYKYRAKQIGVYSLILSNGGAVRFRTRVHNC